MMDGLTWMPKKIQDAFKPDACYRKGEIVAFVEGVVDTTDRESWNSAIKAAIQALDAEDRESIPNLKRLLR